MTSPLVVRHDVPPLALLPCRPLPLPCWPLAAPCPCPAPRAALALPPVPPLALALLAPCPADLCHHEAVTWNAITVLWTPGACRLRPALPRAYCSLQHYCSSRHHSDHSRVSE